MRIESEPPRATVLCDGVVVGVSPTRVARHGHGGCSLHHDDRLPVWFDPATVRGDVASFELPRLAPLSTPPPLELVNGALLGEGAPVEAPPLPSRRSLRRLAPPRAVARPLAGTCFDAREGLFVPCDRGERAP